MAFSAHCIATFTLLRLVELLLHLKEKKNRREPGYAYYHHHQYQVTFYVSRLSQVWHYAVWLLPRGTKDSLFSFLSLSIFLPLYYSFGDGRAKSSSRCVCDDEYDGS